VIIVDFQIGISFVYCIRKLSALYLKYPYEIVSIFGWKRFSTAVPVRAALIPAFTADAAQAYIYQQN
jgi:hypothetical protein